MLSPLSASEDLDSSFGSSAASESQGSPYGSPMNGDGGIGGLKSYLAKREPDPFYHYDMNHNILQPGSPLAGQNIKWSLKNDVTLEDLMYPSLNCLPSVDTLSPLSSPTNFTKKYAKRRNAKSAKQIEAELREKLARERERDLARERDPDARDTPSPPGGKKGQKGSPDGEDSETHGRLYWNVQVSPVRETISRAQRKDTESERISKSINKQGEAYLRDRLKKNLLRNAHQLEQKRKAADAKKQNLLLNAAHHRGQIEQHKVEVFAEPTIDSIIEHDLALEQDADHQRFEEHVTKETPDELFASLLQNMKNKQMALDSFGGAFGGGLSGSRSGSRGKDGGKKGSRASSRGTDAGNPSVEGSLYRQKNMLKKMKNNADNSELEDGLLLFRVRNDLNSKDDDYDYLMSQQNDPNLDPLVIKNKERRERLLNSLAEKRANSHSTGAHLKRALRQNTAVVHGVDYLDDHYDFEPTAFNRSHSEINRSKIDFSPVKLAPSHSRRVAQDVLLVNQFNAKILPEIFIRPHERLTSEFVKKALANDAEIFTLSRKARKKRIKEDAEQEGANSTVNLSSYGVGDEQGLCLGQSLLNFDSLERLILRENRLTAKSIPTIFSHISPTSVMFIDISHNKLNGKVCSKAFSKYFKAPNVCKHLNLSKCGLFCDDVIELCAGLSSRITQSIEELILFGNNIEARGTCALATYLSRVMTLELDPKCFGNKTLGNSICTIKTLNLGWNNISSTGATAIANAITVSTSLINLDLSGNSVSDLAAQRIAAALPYTSSLQILNLQQNYVSSPACFVLSRVLKGHASMVSVDLSFNPVGEPGARSLFRTILSGLKCFVIMRSCTFAIDNSMFNHSNPSVDSPYTLDLDSPYHHTIACTLLDMMVSDSEQCRVTDSSYRDGPKSPYHQLGLHLSEGKEVCEKGKSKAWVVPTKGSLQLSFQYTMILPTARMAMSDTALFVLKIIIVTARTEGDRRNWLKLLYQDVYCTTIQAQGVIDHFVQKKVIGIGGLKKIDVMNAVWPHLLDPHNQVEFFLRNIVEMEERRKMMYGMSLDMFRFNWVNPTGRWRFSLSDVNQRLTMTKFIAINKMESEYSQYKSGREDTSQMEDWCNFRNATYTDPHKEEEEIDEEVQPQQRDSTEEKFIFKPFVINKAFMDNLPYVGVLEFDYVSTRRPLQDAVEMDAPDTAGNASGQAFFANEEDTQGFESFGHGVDVDGNVDEAMDIMPGTIPSRPQTGGSTLRPGSVESGLSTPSRGRLGSEDSLETSQSSLISVNNVEESGGSSEMGSASLTRVGSSSTRPGSVNQNVLRADSRLSGSKHPQAMLITNTELRELLTLIGLSTRERCIPPDTLFALAYLQLASAKYFFHARNVCTVLECFSRDPVTQARVVVVLFSRLWDLHNFDIILKSLSTLAQRETVLRLGYLNILNPLKPAQDYYIDMRYLDSRKALVFCLETGPSEGGDQLRADSASDLTLTDMFSSINRVLKNCLDARVMYSYGEVGERTPHVSWNLRTASMRKFLVGTNPWPKGMQRLIFQYNKLVKEGMLGMGPIEQQYEVMLKRQEEEKVKAASLKEAQKKRRFLQGAVKKVSNIMKDSTSSESAEFAAADAQGLGQGHSNAIVPNFENNDEVE